LSASSAKTWCKIKQNNSVFSRWKTPDERDDIDQYQWDVYSSISDEYLEIETDEELAETTHLIEAIEQNALFLYRLIVFAFNAHVGDNVPY